MSNYTHGEVACAFGLTLRATREKKGVSQDKLGVICNFDRTYPSLMERGLRGPTLAMLLRLADALDVEPAQLVIDTVERLKREVQS